MLLIGIQRRPILPGRFQPSTFSVLRLNFCVRDGNRWDPQAIVTGNIRLWSLRFRTFKTTQDFGSDQEPDFRNQNFRSLRPLCSLTNLFRSSPRPISIINLHTLPHFQR